ncbi:acyltransferase, partial [Levilactobacillus brevis]|nr:acyltransferase [Levilactobacillus brevis]
MRKIRDSRFELLRIIAILMIILSHFSFFGQQYRLHTGISAIDFFGIRLFQPFGALGVYLFV